MVDVIGKAVITVESQLDQQTFGKVGTGMRKALVPAIAALGAIGVASVKAIHAASDLNEQASKAGVVFGKQAGDIRKFADSAANSFGLSSRAALEATGNFGIIAQGAGLSGNAAADFSKKFTGLAADLASFSNTSTDEAITAIGAAMRGESEPIRKYGVLLDDSTLKATALKMGLISNIKEGLTPQQKALAASKVIMEQTTKAQGDYARTSSSAANQARTLAAQSENLSAKLGSALLPAYVAVQKVALVALDWMSRHSTAVTILAAGLGGLALAVVGVNAAMWLLALNPIGIVITAVTLAAAGFAAGLVVLYQKSETFRAGVQALGEKLQEVWDTYFQPTLGHIKHLWDQIGIAMDDISPKFRPILRGLAEIGAATIVLPIVALGKALLYVSKALDAIATTLNGMDGSILDKLLKVINDPRGTVGHLGELSPQHHVGTDYHASGVRNYGGGWSWVGERGPELLKLPRGSDVFTNQESQQMAAAGSGATVNNYFYGPVTGSEQRKETDWSLKYGTRFGAAAMPV